MCRKYPHEHPGAADGGYRCLEMRVEELSDLLLKTQQAFQAESQRGDFLVRENFDLRNRVALLRRQHETL